MLCLGPECRATNFLSCSATKGINVVRVVRDEAYIDKMLAFSRIFHAAFTLKGQVCLVCAYSFPLPPLFSLSPPFPPLFPHLSFTICLVFACSIFLLPFFPFFSFFLWLSLSCVRALSSAMCAWYPFSLSQSLSRGVKLSPSYSPTHTHTTHLSLLPFLFAPPHLSFPQPPPENFAAQVYPEYQAHILKSSLYIDYIEHTHYIEVLYTVCLYELYTGDILGP
jgi:hypothetical protein